MRLLLLGLALLIMAPVVAPGPPRSHPAPELLLSGRALRAARLLIQLRMLELRKERLECVREVLLQRLPPELRPEEATRRMKQAPGPQTTKPERICH